MFKNKETEKLFELFDISNNYQYTSNIANGVDTSFFYLEFKYSSLSYYEMSLALLREQAIFYEIDIHQVICSFSHICCYNEGTISTKSDIDKMKNMILDVTEFMDGYKESWCSNKEREVDDPNNIIAGYYLNNKWQSNDIPQKLTDNIFSADKYITLINEGAELMIAMEHNKKKSIFYSINDQ